MRKNRIEGFVYPNSLLNILGASKNFYLNKLGRGVAPAAQLSTRGIMLLTAAALLPALALRLYYFGAAQALDIALGLALVIICDRLVQGRDFWRHDTSSLVCLLILLIALPPFAHWYTLTWALLWALLVGKYVFGGLGQNIFNPAMVGYACALVALPWEFGAWQEVSWQRKFASVDAVSAATPLAASSQGLDAVAVETYHYHLAAALALGAAPLLYYRLIALKLVASFVLALLAWSALGQALSWSNIGPLEHIFAGGSLLAAIYVITDPVTSPTNSYKQVLYGGSIATLTYAIRTWGSYPDGIAFAILLANVVFL